MERGGQGIQCSGSLTVNSGNINGGQIKISPDGRITINKGKISALGGNASAGAVINDGTLIINDGSFSSVNGAGPAFTGSGSYQAGRLTEDLIQLPLDLRDTGTDQSAEIAKRVTLQNPSYSGQEFTLLKENWSGPTVTMLDENTILTAHNAPSRRIPKDVLQVQRPAWR